MNFRELATPFSHAPVDWVALYRTTDPTRDLPRGLAGAVIISAGAIAGRAIVRALRRRAGKAISNVLLAVNGTRIVVISVRSSAAGWAVDRLVGDYDRDTVICRPLPRDALGMELDLPGFPGIPLYPKYVTADTREIARALLRR
jgi:hypothetical protein